MEVYSDHTKKTTICTYCGGMNGHHHKNCDWYWHGEATRLRGLLVEIHEVVVGEPMQCPSCGVVGCRDDGFCKLEAELKEEK